jgi:lipoprotein-anchoring transpeptidase ErfK/SrfK
VLNTLTVIYPRARTRVRRKGRGMANTTSTAGCEDAGADRPISAPADDGAGELRAESVELDPGPPAADSTASVSAAGAADTDAGAGAVDTDAAAGAAAESGTDVASGGAAGFTGGRGEGGPDGSSGPPPPPAGGGPVRALTERRAILRVGGAAAAAIGAVAAGIALGPRRSATAPPPTVSTVPVNGATGIDPSKPVTVHVSGGAITSVQLSGQPAGGTIANDRHSWVFDAGLGVNTDYRLTVNTVNSLSTEHTVTTSFRTLTPTATLGITSVAPQRGATVGVGHPIRVTLTGSVPDEYKAAFEKACVVTTNPPVTGAWYWVSNDSNGAVVDWRPETFWATGTQVSIAFNLNGVHLGDQRYGAENYPAHAFTISDRDLRLVIDKDSYRATCYENGQAIRTFPIDTGITSAETFVTYTGTMAVLGKGNPVEMKGNYGGGDAYDDFVNWATQITWSGTYVHAAPWDPDIGSANDDSHGCIHCRTEDAQWFYGKNIAGDVVTITGSRARPVAIDNGICTFTLDWPAVVAGSAYGPTRNGKPVSA